MHSVFLLFYGFILSTFIVIITKRLMNKDTIKKGEGRFVFKSTNAASVILFVFKPFILKQSKDLLLFSTAERLYFELT